MAGDVMMMQLATQSTPQGAFPVGDWQFWVVTLVFALAVAWLCWNVLPLKQLIRRGKAAPKRTVLTVEGQKPAKPDAPH